MRFSNFSLIFLFFIATIFFANDCIFGDTSSASHKIRLRVEDCSVFNLNDSNTVEMSLGYSALNRASNASVTDSSKRIYFTSLVPTGKKRNITVSLDTGNKPPTGTELSISAHNIPAGCSTPEKIVLSDMPKILIANINSCSSGSNGVPLDYQFRFTDTAYQKVIIPESTMITINFTLTDAS